MRKDKGLEQIEIICMDEMGMDYLLRKIDEAIGFTHVYDPGGPEL